MPLAGKYRPTISPGDGQERTIKPSSFLPPFARQAVIETTTGRSIIAIEDASPNLIN